MSALGQKRKSRTTILMSVIPPKAEVSLSRFDVRYVLFPEVAMPVEEPSTASRTNQNREKRTFRALNAWAALHGVSRSETRPLEVLIDPVGDPDGVRDDLVVDRERGHHCLRVECRIPGLELLGRLHDVHGLAFVGHTLLREGEPGHLTAD